jgi:hypothetical protein
MNCIEDPIWFHVESIICLPWIVTPTLGSIFWIRSPRGINVNIFQKRVKKQKKLAWPHSTSSTGYQLDLFASPLRDPCPVLLTKLAKLFFLSLSCCNHVSSTDCDEYLKLAFLFWPLVGTIYLDSVAWDWFICVFIAMFLNHIRSFGLRLLVVRPNRCLCPHLKISNSKEPDQACLWLFFFGNNLWLFDSSASFQVLIVLKKWKIYFRSRNSAQIGWRVPKHCLWKGLFVFSICYVVQS